MSARQIIKKSASKLSRTRCSFSSVPDAENVFSRRVWIAYRLKQGPKEKASKEAPSASDEKPWPNSVIYTAYVAAATLIPYCTTWLIASNPSLRALFLKEDAAEDWKIQKVREHFGQIDPDSASYCDLMDRVTTLEYRLPLEWSSRERAQEALIQRENVKDIDCSVGTVTNQEMAGDFVDRKLPASTPARRQDLLQLLGDQATSGGEVAIVFRDEDPSEEELQSEMLLSAQTNSSSDGASDPLLARVYTHSLWLYQNPDLVMKPANSTKTSLSSDEIETSRLEFDIARLEAELKGGISNRPVDDIMDELRANKGQLRRLKLRKWVPF